MYFYMYCNFMYIKFNTNDDLDLLHFVGLVISCHYIPQLAKLMVEINKKHNMFNLKRIDVSMIKK